MKIFLFWIFCVFLYFSLKFSVFDVNKNGCSMLEIHQIVVRIISHWLFSHWKHAAHAKSQLTLASKFHIFWKKIRWKRKNFKKKNFMKHWHAALKTSMKMLSECAKKNWGSPACFFHNFDFSVMLGTIALPKLTWFDLVLTSLASIIAKNVTSVAENIQTFQNTMISCRIEHFWWS